MTVRKTEWQRTIERKLGDHEKKLSEQEKANAVYAALQQEQRKHLDERFSRVQDNVNQIKKDLTSDVTEIKSGINKVLWAFGAAIIIAIVQFVLAGGLKIPV